MTTTIQVHIKTKCNFCNGEAYTPIGKAEDINGEIYTRYQACGYCQATGLRERWISLIDFVSMLDEVDPMEPDYEYLAQQEPTSQYRDSRDAAGI